MRLSWEKMVIKDPVGNLPSSNDDALASVLEGNVAWCWHTAQTSLKVCMTPLITVATVLLFTVCYYLHQLMKTMVIFTVREVCILCQQGIHNIPLATNPAAPASHGHSRHKDRLSSAWDRLWPSEAIPLQASLQSCVCVTSVSQQSSAIINRKLLKRKQITDLLNGLQIFTSACRKWPKKDTWTASSVSGGPTLTATLRSNTPCPASRRWGKAQVRRVLTWTQFSFLPLLLEH